LAGGGGQCVWAEANIPPQRAGSDGKTLTSAGLLRRGRKIPHIGEKKGEKAKNPLTGAQAQFIVDVEIFLSFCGKLTWTSNRFFLG
jgi:hypothetical protein